MTTPGVFWGNDEYIAFLSKWPNTRGFTVLTTKQHYDSNIYELPEDILMGMLRASKEVSQLLIRHFDDVGRVGLIFEGMGVNHAHLKLFPMHGTDFLKRGEWKQAQSENKTFFETYEGYISSHDGPQADEGELRDLAESLRKMQSAERK